MNQSLHSSARGHAQKASFRSVIVNQAWFLGIWLRRQYGLGTTGCLAMVLLLTSFRSCTSLYFPSAFLTATMGVLCGYIQGFKIPSCNNCSITIARLLLPSEEIGYCLPHMGEVPSCIFIVISGMSSSPRFPSSAHFFGFISAILLGITSFSVPPSSLLLG